MVWWVTASASEPARQTGQLPPASSVKFREFFIVWNLARYTSRSNASCYIASRQRRPHPSSDISPTGGARFLRTRGSGAGRFLMCHLQDDPDAIGEHVGVHGEGMLVFTASTG